MKTSARRRLLHAKRTTARPRDFLKLEGEDGDLPKTLRVAGGENRDLGFAVPGRRHANDRLVDIIRSDDEPRLVQLERSWSFAERRAFVGPTLEGPSSRMDIRSEYPSCSSYRSARRMAVLLRF